MDEAVRRRFQEPRDGFHREKVVTHLLNSFLSGSSL